MSNDTTQRDLGRVEGKVDSLTVSVNQLIARLDRRDATVDERIGRVEKKTNWMAGAGSIIGSLAGFIITALIHNGKI